MKINPTTHSRSVVRNGTKEGSVYAFKGNAKAVDTRDLWRSADQSPVNQGHHYNHHAETYYETGERLGRAMAYLLDQLK